MSCRWRATASWWRCRRIIGWWGRSRYRPRRSRRSACCCWKTATACAIRRSRCAACWRGIAATRTPSPPPACIRLCRWWRAGSGSPCCLAWRSRPASSMAPTWCCGRWPEPRPGARWAWRGGRMRRAGRIIARWGRIWSKPAGRRWNNHDITQERFALAGWDRAKSRLSFGWERRDEGFDCDGFGYCDDGGCPGVRADRVVRNTQVHDIPAYGSGPELRASLVWDAGRRAAMAADVGAGGGSARFLQGPNGCDPAEDRIFEHGDAAVYDGGRRDDGRGYDVCLRDEVGPGARSARPVHDPGREAGEPAGAMHKRPSDPAHQGKDDDHFHGRAGAA